MLQLLQASSTSWVDLSSELHKPRILKIEQGTSPEGVRMGMRIHSLRGVTEAIRRDVSSYIEKDPRVPTAKNHLFQTLTGQ